MSLFRFVTALFLCIVLTGVTAGQNAEDIELEFEVHDESVNVGSDLDANAELSGPNSSEAEISFFLGDKELEPEDERRLDYEVTLEDYNENRENVSVRVEDDEGERIGFASSKITIEPPRRDYDLSVTPEKVRPGEEVEAKVTYDGETLENLNYDWQVPSPEEDIGSSPEIKFETSKEIHGDEEGLRVRIEDGEGDRLDIERENFEWDPYETEVEGLDVEYGEGEAKITVSEEKLNEAPKIRLGESMDAFSQIQVSNRDHSGDAEIKIEELSGDDYQTKNGLEVRSVIEISGENAAGLGINPGADVSRDWLDENNLLIGERSARAGYYHVEDGEWKAYETEHSRSNADNHIEIRTIGDDRFVKIEEGSHKIGLAGNPDGFDFGRYVKGPEGQCEELEEGEPVPPGWEELEIDCDIHRDAQRMKDRMDQRLERFDAAETTINISERKDEIEETIDNYKLNEAEEMIDELEEDVERSRERTARSRSQRGGRNFGADEVADSQMQQVEAGERANETLNQLNISGKLPEDNNLTYERTEELQNLFDKAQSQIEEENYEEAMSTIGEIREKQTEMEGYREAVKISRMLEQVDEYRERYDLSEEQSQELDQVETLLAEDQNISGAERKLSDVQEDMEMERVKQFIKELLQDEEIRNMVKDIISDIMPF